MGMNPIDTIIFDYGGVVADHYVEPFQSQLGKILHTTQKGTRELTSEKSSHGRDYRLGKITKKEFWEAIKKLSNTEFDIDFVHDLFVKTYLPNPAMLSLIKFLKNEKGIQAGLALNTDIDRWEHVRRIIPADELFSVIVISHQIGVIKPEKAFYKEMLKAAKRTNNPNRVMYVDDRKSHVEGAVACGLQGYVFINAGDFATSVTHFNLNRFSP